MRPGIPAWPVGIGLVACSVLALSLAWPFAMARLAEIPGNGVTGFLNRSTLVAEGGMERLDASRRAALEWVERAQPHRELGLALFARAQASTDEALRRPLLEQAQAEFRQALRLAPVDPQVLAMLTAVELGLGDNARARDVLTMAHAMAPVSPEFSLIRSWTAMSLWDDLPEATRQTARGDFVMAMRTRPRQLVSLARSSDFVQEVRDALAADPAAPELLEAFEDALGESHVYPRGPASSSRR